MKSRFYIWLSLVAGLLATSCNDAFMDRQPHTEIGADSYFNTEEDLKMYCYGLINTPGYNYTADAGTDDQATTDNVEVKNIILRQSYVGNYFCRLVVGTPVQYQFLLGTLRKGCRSFRCACTLSGNSPLLPGCLLYGYGEAFFGCSLV